jgi:hypothetical protein
MVRSEIKCIYPLQLISLSVTYFKILISFSCSSIYLIFNPGAVALLIHFLCLWLEAGKYFCTKCSVVFEFGIRRGTYMFFNDLKVHL